MQNARACPKGQIGVAVSRFDSLRGEATRIKGVRLIPKQPMPVDGIYGDVGQGATRPDYLTSKAHVADCGAHHYGSRWVEAHRLLHHLARVRQGIDVRLAKRAPLRDRLNLLDDALRDFRCRLSR